jgi:hypothetical protein
MSHQAPPSACIAQLNHLVTLNCFLINYTKLSFGSTVQARLVVLRKSDSWSTTCPTQTTNVSCACFDFMCPVHYVYSILVIFIVIFKFLSRYFRDQFTYCNYILSLVLNITKRLLFRYIQILMYLIHDIV